MIHVDRDRFPVPELFASSKVEQARKELEEFFGMKRKTRAQKRFEFQRNIYLDPEVKDALIRLFNGKCAYCESHIGMKGYIDIDHFRPKTGAMDLKGHSDPDHYYWLAYEWDNLYPACPSCNRSKRAYFPVIGGRALPGAMGDELKREKALLIDPCLDYPEMYLDFKEDGMVYPRLKIYDTDTQLLKQQDISNIRRIRRRATTTIEILGLNRKPIVEARKEAAKFVNTILYRRPETKGFNLFEKTIKEVLDITQPYLGLKRQMVEQWFLKTIKARNTPGDLREFLMELASNLDIKLPLEKPKMEAKPEQVSRRGKVLIEKSAPPAMPSLRIDYIKSIEIRNFKIIKDINLKFSPGREEMASWKVLVGENGTGKSSVLEAVALALMGEDRLEEFKDYIHLDPERILRHRTRNGFVKIGLTDKKEPVTLKITREGFEYESGAEGVNTFLNAYGTTRLLPHIELMQTKTGFREAVICENLFNPFKPLLDVDKYLYSLKRGREFDSTALMLKDLLNLSVESKLFRRAEKIRVQIGEDDDPQPLDQLSDGYQSVTVLSTDIMKNYPEKLYDLQKAMGIVLLDEIGTYLHPRWKMTIVNSLRTAFPRIQFLATTHEPLCLRGLREREITIMERDGDTGEILVNDDVPSPEGLRVDQLLTSDLFGLHSTIDPYVEREFEEYYNLLAKHELTPEEKEKRDDLKKKLAEYDTKLGATPREQLLYEAIDEYLAKKKRMSQKESEKERAKVKRKIVELWKKFDENSGKTK
ncbi:MAG: hypothetical protein A7316_01690 [Candidatus Altiarchaeales archaeon WOR_SM1_86-2]|nr:MAG: hypothetical protein A7315_04395 [Candidatus Altiarchaeales archaeon WOR_SM1_79]ODS37523.1 MAG: hypothetical protein A7316_01690 [Candidatus Altiarchaeales archaeon WOR_SM1_86-2]